MPLGKDYLDAVSGMEEKKPSLGADYLHAVEGSKKASNLGADYLAAVGDNSAPAPQRSFIGNVGAALARGGQALVGGLADASRMNKQPISQIAPALATGPAGIIAAGASALANMSPLGQKVQQIEKNIGQAMRESAQTGWEAPRAPEMDEALRGKIEQINQKYLAENRLGSEEHANEINKETNWALFTQRPVMRSAEIIAEGVPSYAAAILATLVTKNPAIGAVILGEQQGGSTFAEAEAAGQSKAKAALLGQLDMAWTSVTEKIAFDAILGHAGKSIINRILSGGGAEAVQELVQTVGSNAIAKLGWDHARELTRGWLEALIGGFGLGMMGGAITNRSSISQNAPIPGVAEADQAQAQELVAGGLDPATVTAWSQAPDEATKQQILTDALKPPAPEQPLGEPTVQGTPPSAEKSVASAPPPLPGAAAQSPELMTPDEVRSMNLYHGGLEENKTLADIDLNRAGTQQDKKGRGYGGFYLATEEARSKAWAEKYANERGGNLHRISLNPDARVARAENIPELAAAENIDRLDAATRAKLSERYDAVIGRDALGREQVVLLNKNTVASFERGIREGDRYVFKPDQRGNSQAGISAQSPDADALQAMTDDISRTRKPVPPDQFSVAEPPPDRAEEVAAVNQATSLLGKKVVWFKNNKPENIRFNGTLTDDTIFINVDAKQPYVKIAMHESLHRMKTEQPDLYGKFMAVVKTEGSGFDQFRNELLSAYKAQGIAVDENSDWVWEELAADTLGDRGQDKTFWSDLYLKSPEAVKAIVDTIQKVMATLSGQSQTPEMAKYFKDFQKVHDAAVSVMSEYAAARSTDASLTQKGSPAVSTDAAATLPASKKPTARKPTDTSKTNPALEAWRDETRSAGIRPDPVINEADMGGTIPPGTIRKDSRDTWDSALMRALNAGLITEDEAGQPETFQRLMAGENVTVKDDLSAETKHMMAKQEGELIDALKRGETVDEQAFKYFPAAEKFRNYGKTKDNPATVGGLEVYHDGKVWKARKPGGNFKKVEGAIAERLDAAMPGVAEDKVPFSIDREQDAAYMKAVEAGDTATAQKMVDEAAKAAGRIIVTRSEEIGVETQPAESKPQGLYLNREGEKTGVEEDFGPPKRFFFSPKRPLDVSGDNHLFEHRRFQIFNGVPRSDAGSAGLKALRQLVSEAEFSRLTKLNKIELAAELNGKYPSVEWSRYYDSYEMLEGLAGTLSRSAGYDAIIDTDELVALKNLESADPITRDDQGNVIPLSKRFNPQQDDIRFSIDDDLTAEFDKLYPEPEPARPKLAKRILDDPEYTEDAKNFAKSLVKEVRGLEEDAGVAGEFIDAEGTTVARAKVMAKQTGLKDSQAAVVAQMLHKTYDRLIRVAEKEGKPEEAREIAKMNDELGAFITEQQQEGGRLTNAWKYNLTTASWDTASGMAATFEGMVERSNAKHPEVKTVEQQLELAQKTIQQVAKEAADKALANQALKSRIDALDADRNVLKRRLEINTRIASEGYASWEKNPESFKSLNDKYKARWKSGTTLLGKFAEKAKLSIESARAMLSVSPKMLSESDFIEASEYTEAWINEQREAGKPYTFGAWKTWAEGTFGKYIFEFDDSNDIYDQAKDSIGIKVSNLKSGRKAPKTESIIRRSVKATTLAERAVLSELKRQDSTNAKKRTRVALAGPTINEILYQTATQRNATLKTLTERLVNEAGYSGSDAADLAVKINSAFRDVIARRGKQMLEAKFRDRGTKPRGRTKNVLDDILKSIKLGALSDADIKAKLYDKYGLTTVSPEAEAKFAELAAKVADETDKRYNAAKAKGYTDAQIALQDDSVGMRTAKEAAAKYMASQVKHGLNDYAWSWVHFSLLSSPYTWLFNSVANNSQLLGITTARALQGIVKAPFDRGRTLRQLSNGLSAMIGATPGAFAEAYNTMVTGEGVIRGNDKFDSDPSKYNVFESSEFLDKHPVLKAPLVFVRRILQATDILSAMQLRELQSAMMTTSIAQSEGLTGIPLAERVAEMMGRGPLNMKKYESMADAEGLTGINRFRRINQLVENNREQDIRENASVFSAWHTFNSQMPRGFIGDAAMMLNNFALRNQDHPIVGIPARSLGLFVRISANVSNIILDYSPYGFERARRGKVRLSNGKTYEMNDLYEGLRADVVTQAAMGTAMMTTALLHALSAFMKWKEDPDKDKKNPDFSVYGPGPSDPALRQVWMEAGGRPWSIQFGNGNAIPYKWAAPVAIPLALVGLWMDGERFKKENEEEDSRVWRMTGGMAVGLLQYIMQQSPMTAMNSAFRAINGFGGKDEENRFRKYVTGFTGFAIPNFISWIDKSIDPTVYSANDWLSAFTKNVPFVRGNALMPSLNLFGEPIEYAPSERFLGDAKSDTEMMWLTNNNVGIAKPNRPYMVDYKTGKQHEITEEEYYKLIKYFGPRFREALRFAIPRMNNLTHDQKKERVTQLKSDAYEYAKHMLYKETQLRAETKEKAEEVEAWFERRNSAVDAPTTM